MPESIEFAIKTSRKNKLVCTTKDNINFTPSSNFFFEQTLPDSNLLSTSPLFSPPNIISMPIPSSRFLHQLFLLILNYWISR